MAEKRGSWNGEKKRKCILGVCYNFRAYGRPMGIACLVTCTLATRAGVPRGSMVMRLCRVNIFGSRFLLDCRFCRFRDYEMNEPPSVRLSFLIFSCDFVSCRFSSGTEDGGIQSGFFCCYL